MNSTSNFFIQTACVAGITPLGMDVAARPPREGRSHRRPAAIVAADRQLDEVLATFGDRWEW